MGSLDDDDENTQPVWDDETQPIDSPCSTPSEPADKRIEDDNFDFLQNTLPFDTVPADDQFETQVLDIWEDTQVLEDLDDVEENATEVLDDLCTEVADSDSEKTDGTEVLEDVQDSTDDEAEVCTPTPKLDSLTGRHHLTETVRRDFTSVRAASLRASGLAARSQASKETNSGSMSFKSDGQTLKLHDDGDNETALVTDSPALAKEIDEKNLLEVNDDQTKILKNDDKGKIGSSAVRRLFADDSLAGTRESDNCTNNADLREELPQLQNDAFETAGLSYVDSQEPGDLSQANALDVVDKLLEFDIGDFDQEPDIERSTGGKSEKCLSGAKGVQNLAKITNLRSRFGTTGAFDWDDRLEDEGGGEFFTKKKEALFDGEVQKKKTFTQPRKVKHLDTERNVDANQTRNKRKKPDTNQKLQGLDSSRISSMPAEIIKTSNKDLTKELNKQSKLGSLDAIEDKGAGLNAPEMLDVGLDTQMAAEAMEALCSGLYEADHHKEDTNQLHKSMSKGSCRSEKNTVPQSKNLQKRATRSRSRILTKGSKETEVLGANLNEKSPLSHKQAKKARNLCDTELRTVKPKKAKKGAKGFSKNSIQNMEVLPEVNGQAEEPTALKRNCIDENNGRLVVGSSSECLLINERHLQEQAGKLTPIAHRTRQRRVTNPSGTGASASHSGEEIHLTEEAALNGRKRKGSLGTEASLMLASKRKTRSGSNELSEVENMKLFGLEKSQQESIDMVTALRFGDSSWKRRRTRQNRPGQLDGSSNPRAAVNQSVVQDPIWQSLRKSNRLRTTALNPSSDGDVNMRTQSSVFTISGLHSSNSQLPGSLSLHGVEKDDAIEGNCVDGTAPPADLVIGLEASPGERYRSSGSASTTPSNCATSKAVASPICMGDEYPKQSCRKNLLKKSLLVKEISSLVSTAPSPISTTKESRKRRDMTNVRVLFSHHLDDDIIKQQKKILNRLGASVASSISEATHFVAKKFVRTRNMLEAIALGKPVVTQLWLESCGQASCFIDERNHILRDSRKEKELGFSLPVSLAHACRCPLLQGQKVFITPNTKPGKEILADLVKAVHGLPVERVGRSALKDKDIPDDLMVLSCEEDFSICVPFLEKGAEVYSSELLLNGIVIQKLEYDRHRLFVDHVKKTRSTIWLKHGSKTYRPVTKRK